MSEELIKELIELAKRVNWEDDLEDFNPYDYSGGNFDDCYWSGQKDGETRLARKILDKLNISYA